MRLKIRHNMEIAHRLSKDTGKCLNIHGHGMQVELTLLVSEGPEGMAMNGIMETMEFGALKKAFRKYIDETYDHRLVLNQADPLTGPIFQMNEAKSVDGLYYESKIDDQFFLPGLSIVPGDPTVENLAKWIAHWACTQFTCDVICNVAETQTNGAEAMYHFNGTVAQFVEGAR